MLLPIKSPRENPQISPRERNSSSLTSSGSKRGEQRFPRPDKETLYCNLRNSVVHVFLCGNRFLYRLQTLSWFHSLSLPSSLFIAVEISANRKEAAGIKRSWKVYRGIGADNWSKTLSCFSFVHLFSQLSSVSGNFSIGQTSIGPSETLIENPFRNQFLNCLICFSKLRMSL